MTLTVQILGQSNRYWSDRFREEAGQLSDAHCCEELSLRLSIIWDQIVPHLNDHDWFNLGYWLWRTGIDEYIDVSTVKSART